MTLRQLQLAMIAAMSGAAYFAMASMPGMCSYVQLCAAMCLAYDLQMLNQRM